MCSSSVNFLFTIASPAYRRKCGQMSGSLMMFRLWHAGPHNRSHFSTTNGNYFDYNEATPEPHGKWNFFFQLFTEMMKI